MHLKIEFAQFCLKSDRQKIEGQGGVLTAMVTRKVFMNFQEEKSNF